MNVLLVSVIVTQPVGCGMFDHDNNDWRWEFEFSGKDANLYYEGLRPDPFVSPMVRILSRTNQRMIAMASGLYEEAVVVVVINNPPERAKVSIASSTKDRSLKAFLVQIPKALPFPTKEEFFTKILHVAVCSDDERASLANVFELSGEVQVSMRDDNQEIDSLRMNLRSIGLVPLFSAPDVTAKMPELTIVPRPPGRATIDGEFVGYWHKWHILL